MRGNLMLPDILGEFNGLYKHFNSSLFHGSLPKAEFHFDPAFRGCLRFTPPSLILIGSKIVTVRELEEIFDELLHEMVHVSNNKDGIEDKGKNQYHNMNFLDSATQIGLYVLKQKAKGWGTTTSDKPKTGHYHEPSEENIVKRLNAYNSAKFDENCLSKLVKIVQNHQEKNRRRDYFLKYVCNCPPPHNSIRSGRRPDGPNALLARCEICQSKFVLADA